MKARIPKYMIIGIGHYKIALIVISVLLLLLMIAQSHKRINCAMVLNTNAEEETKIALRVIEKNVSCRKE